MCVVRIVAHVRCHVGESLKMNNPEAMSLNQ
jgi:hypothetical protein